MSRKNVLISLLGLSMLSVMVVATSGCLATQFGPQLGLACYPIPVSPYFQEKFEDIAWEDERYNKVLIMGPLVSGGPVKALDPPSDDEIMRALEKASPVEGGVPLMYTKQRNNVKIVKYKLQDYIDPEPRFVPMAGPCQLHHAHYLCKIYYQERTIVGWPIPYTVENQDAQEVVYVDHDHFHMVGNVDGGPSAEW